MNRRLAAWLLVVACVEPARAVSPGCDIAPDAALAQVNALRAQGAACGSRGRFAAAAPLAWHDALESMARHQASWLAFTDELRHTGPQGQTLGDRARAVGYAFAGVAENLAQGQHALADALRDWTRSESHCANLYSATFTQAGLACQTAADGRPLWVMVYARPL